jgi:long-chain acyl-CoA synthetase
MIATQAAASPAQALASAKNLVELALIWERQPKATAALHKVAGRWQSATWGEVVSRVRALSEALLATGVRAGDRVCLMANTRLDWCIVDLAIMGAGAITVPIYASNTVEEIGYLVRDSGAKVLVVDDDVPEHGQKGRLGRVLEACAGISQLEQVIAIDLPSDPARKVVGLAELEARGRQALAAAPRGLEERAAKIGSDDLACIIYTSGTTGNPKGVMLTHGNWTSQAKAMPHVGLMSENDVVLLFLPLAHSFAKVVEAAWLGQGFTMAFAESIEKAVDNAAEVHATVIPAVPRVFEKAFIRVVGDGMAQPGLKGKLFGWALGEFERYAAAMSQGQPYSALSWKLARALVFSKVQQKLQDRFGGRVRAFVSGGAPLATKVGWFFDVCGLVILEGYGLTETSAPTHVNSPTHRKLGTVGQAFPGVQTRIAEDGEILLKGPPVMKGYFRREAETAAVLEDGWFRTGDIGVVDADGFLRITDRKKDLIKTSGGKYVAPQELENGLKIEPLVSQVVVVGDRRNYVTALITVSEEAARKWAQENGLGQLSYPELTKRPEVRARIQKAVDALNAHLPSYATIKKFELLEQDFSQNTGELTPKLSVKRKVVLEKYKARVDAMYGGEAFA